MTVRMPRPRPRPLAAGPADLLRGGGAPCGGAPFGPVTLMALLRPSGAVSKSNHTSSPSSKLRKPDALILLWCTNRSSVLSSDVPEGVMKPKPFMALNHLTVPVCSMLCSSPDG
eukprot:CAMPEP_0119111624 /NCGR_PEP_ID=MMETSP1180-20130426/36495_1 /TAXON_ID=3052 ORGANISM="Chlamydomonas cf sp, Strain CCMP681" /NCGR_SAMPLE_ID=MMETSP1180 /ASSEMBLY_ACC=CAM_ASM_000741 /LENGTH=113 /DNA_ID=CAMNT_0007098687 /DNA_START=54 /DNA_END=395 /DNA_ORIENTATION=-